MHVMCLLGDGMPRCVIGQMPHQAPATRPWPVPFLPQIETYRVTTNLVCLQGCTHSCGV